MSVEELELEKVNTIEKLDVLTLKHIKDKLDGGELSQIQIIGISAILMTRNSVIKCINSKQNIQP